MPVAKQRQPGAARASAPLTDYLTPIFSETGGAAQHLAVAVSGGADSIALALIARAWCATHGKQLTALTVDHGLRAASAAEAAQVAQWMQARGIAHAILAPPALPIPNLQARARAMRYGALGDWCCAHGASHLLLAHHFDDQAETALLQRHRGSTPPSRAGMALVSTRPQVMLVRPLLGVRKQHLETYLRVIGQTWIDDPSNRDMRFDRNRLRTTLDEATRIASWHAAQRAGEQRHRDEARRRDWLAAHAAVEQASIVIDRAAWVAQPLLARMDYLSHLIRTVGGRTHRPRLAETQRLTDRIENAHEGKATLGHCQITWSEARVRIAPEHSLESGAAPPHITGDILRKALGKEPFWWFAYAPLNDGVFIAAH